VELDGERLPVAGNAAMSRFRLVKVSIIPQYAMCALNPTRKVGRIIADVLLIADEITSTADVSIQRNSGPRPVRMPCVRTGRRRVPPRADSRAARRAA
jgi:ABC-type dipeptide/oligopeptide/nickel transport system ATPase component